MAEVRAAVDALILNPPEGWTGMPKLPDVIRQIAENREYQAEQSRIAKGAEVQVEMRELEKRKAEHPEEFMSWGQFCELLKADKPELAAKLGMKMPQEGGLDFDRNAEKLRQQAEMLKGKQ